jgi:hypothetical protein
MWGIANGMPLPCRLQRGLEVTGGIDGKDRKNSVHSNLVVFLSAGNLGCRESVN